MNDFPIVCAFVYMDRLRGLFALPKDFDGVLLIAPCKSIHTFGLNKGLDIAFLSKDFRIMRVQSNVLPGKVLSCRGAWGVLERYVSCEPWLQEGEYVQFWINRRRF